MTVLSPGQTGDVFWQNTIKHCLVTKHFTLWTPCLVLFDRVWSCLSRVWWAMFCFLVTKQCLMVFGLQTFIVWPGPIRAWTATYQTCLMRACVPRLLSGLYQLFDLCLIKHVLTVWPLTSTLACLVTKQCLMVFGHQTFSFCPGPNTQINKLTSVFYASVLLLIMNFVITLSK